MKIIGFIAIVEVTTNMYYYGVQFSLDQIGTDFGYNILLTGLIEAAAYFSFSNFLFMKIFLWRNYPEKKGCSFSMLEVLFWDSFSWLDTSMTIRCLPRFCLGCADISTVIFIVTQHILKESYLCYKTSRSQQLYSQQGGASLRESVSWEVSWRLSLWAQWQMPKSTQWLWFHA